MPTLYELTEQYHRLMELAGEVDEEAFQEALTDLTDDIENKADNIARVTRNMQGDIDTLKAEEKRLKERRTALEKKQTNLKEYLLNEMSKLDIPKVQSAHFTISVRNNPPKVNVLDENVIPEHYKVATYRIDKKALNEDLKDGIEVEGVNLQYGKGLTIK